jgi:shikimate kinase
MLIFLIGYMGSGKSTIGLELASLIEYPFFDMDQMIETQEGLTVAEIFRKKGEKAFRLLEHDTLTSLLSEKKAVIAVGGGTPCFFNQMETMNRAGVTIYLKVDVEILYGRLKDNTDSRPLIKNFSCGDLKEFISNHLEEREVYYQKASIVHDPFASTVRQLLEELKKIYGTLSPRSSQTNH